MEHGSLRDFLQQPDVELEWHLDPLLRIACDIARAMCALLAPLTVARARAARDRPILRAIEPHSSAVA